MDQVDHLGSSGTCGAQSGAVPSLLIGEFNPSIAVLPTEPPEVLARFEAAPEVLERLAAQLSTATQGRVSCLMLGEDE